MKLQTRVSGVDFVCQNGNPDGVEFCYFNFFANQPLHDIQIVSSGPTPRRIQRARGEFADAMDFEVDRIANVRSQRDQCGIEAFEMPDL